MAALASTHSPLPRSHSHSRPSSACSNHSEVMADGESESLLHNLDKSFGNTNDQHSLSLDQLESFFRVCANALAAKNGSLKASRATTFAANATSRTTTTDMNTFETKLGSLAEPLGTEQKPGEKAQDHDTRQLLLQQTREWNDRRKEWQSILDTVDDVWHYYFPSCDHHNDPEMAATHAAHCHPLSNSTLRMKTQQDLVLARLCLEHDASNVRHASRFSPWLSLIGYKLAQIHTLSPKFAETFIRKPVVHGLVIERGNILSMILRYFHEGPFFYLARHNEFRISDMLDFCYMRGVLPCPENQTDHLLEVNFRLLVHGIWCLNILQTPRYRLTFTYPWNEVQQRLPVMGFHFLGLRPSEAVLVSFEEIERRLKEEPPDLPQAVGDNVRCSDLNIPALRNIGGLKIVWTTCDRDHLFLDQESGVLRLGWFNRVLVPEFYKYMPMLGRNDVNHTWELLLSHRKHQYDFTELEKITLAPELKAYNHLGAKRHVWSGLRANRKESDSVALQHPPRNIPDVIDKYESLPNLPHSVPYSYFGRYEERVRILRHYMDTRKPVGFRNLWHDRRDSLTYYTFWAVMVFGGLSVVLAALGLVVGILQAYASLKALG